MDNCLVCLETMEYSTAQIRNDCKEWKDFHIGKVITKHLWWWYHKPPRSQEDTSIEYICRQCWHELYTFNKFYLKVEKLHHNYITANEISCEDSVKTRRYSKRTKCKETAEQISDIIIKVEGPTIMDNRMEDGLVQEDLCEMQEANDREVLTCHAHRPNIAAAPINGNDEDRIILNNNGNERIQFEFEQYNTNDGVYICNENYDNDEETGSEQLREHITSQSDITVKRKYNEKNMKLPHELRKSDDMKKESVRNKNDEYISNNFVLNCEICSKILDNFTLLSKHFSMEHNTRGYVSCCSKKFYRSGLLVDHLEMHKNSEFFKCLECSKVLGSRRSWERHMEAHLVSQAYKCDECGKNYSQAFAFRMHKLKHSRVDPTPFECTECDKKFGAKHLLKIHTDNMHRLRHVRVCHICGKNYRDRFSFECHMKLHAGEHIASATCDICGFVSANKNALRRHKKLKHSQNPKYEEIHICPYCSKESPSLIVHTRHINYSHLLERKYACHICEKAFRLPKELQEHLSVHTGEALYICPYCPRTFNSNGNMHKHRKIKHRKEWEEARLIRRNPRQLISENNKIPTEAESYQFLITDIHSLDQSNSMKSLNNEAAPLVVDVDPANNNENIFMHY